VTVHNLDGRFPDGDEQARRALHEALESIPDDDRVVVDGLAMGALPEVVGAHADRLRLVGLVHHPLADETGLAADTAARLETLESRALAHARGVVVTSLFTAERLGSLGVGRERIRAVRPGTDPAPQATGPTEGEPARLLCVGSFAPRKGQDVLVRALALVQDLPWTCTFAGSLDRDPGYADGVRHEIELLGLRGRVELSGELGTEALDELYATATLFVLPSHYEGYGMALAEALARGLPVVSTTGGAIPHTVPEDAGVLVSPGDVDALAEALRALLDDPHRREQLAVSARRHASDLPDWASQAAAFAAAVRELTARG
jgi:glycosyltransferase involved in cell wall biosynthesis